MNYFRNLEIFRDGVWNLSGSDPDSGVSDISDSVFSIVADEPPACGGSWFNSAYSGNDTFNAITYGGGKFVAVGNNGVIKTSVDGSDWSARASNTADDLYGITYGYSTFVVVGENGAVLTSPDGINWTSRASGTVNTLYGITYGNVFAAVGVSGTVLTSQDGVDWANQSVNIFQTLYGAAYGNGIYVVVGAGGEVLSSPDGTNWMQRSSGTSQALGGVIFGDNQFVGVGGNGVILTSSNGINWTGRTSSINVDLMAAAYGNGVYVIVGDNGKVLTSEDLVTWESQASGVRVSLFGVVFGNSRFVAVGADEIIYSICEQSAAANVLNNQKLLRGVQGGGFLEKSPPGRRRQETEESIDVKASLNLVSPNGDEMLQAGEKFLITWKHNPEVEKVQLEYSPDNGTTYLPIAVDVDNIGHYEWLAPHHISSHCLVRVSEVKERKMPPHGLVYEMDFRVNDAEFSGSSERFFIYLGDAADESIKNNLPGVSFGYETNGRVYIHLDDTSKEIGRVTDFNERWHNIRVFMDNVYDRISVILDGKLVFESIPRSPMAYFSPALSIAVGPGNDKEVEIDDVSVSAFYSLEDKNQWITLFHEDFRQLKDKNGIENTGWRTKSEQALDGKQKDTVLRCLTIKSCEGEQVTVVKSFNVPIDFPFDISDKTFEIRYNDDMYTDSAANDISPGHGGSGASTRNFYSSSSTTLNRTPGISRTAEMFNTYYIYTFDGKLLAEYDHNGNCVRDYIYFGDRLLAEYKPQTNEYFYYMTDQINSTRIITDDSGNVVFSEAYGPYGDVQKTWVNTYNPKLKFSGKEREGYSDLDYFGARYYDHKSYRFNSVDPVITKDEALSNPQLWNLYAYCRNNPITYFDPDGKIEGSAARRILVYNQLYNKWLKEGGREYADQKWELIYQSEFVAGLAGAAGALFLAAPEIIAATGPAIRIAGDKIANFFSRFSSTLKDLFSRGYQISQHAAERMIQRGVSSNQLKSVLEMKPFKYFHEGIWKVGHYDSVSKIFVGRVGNIITTVITNVKPQYIENLKKLR